MKNPQILDLYSDYLIATFQLATATGLSELVGGAISHDKISRFLGQSLFTQKDYWKCVKPLVRKVENDFGIIKIDDTIEEKPHSTENDIICWHWDHSKKPRAGHVKGVNILNFQYHSILAPGQDISIVAAFEVVKKDKAYYDVKTKKVKKRSAVTKNQMVRERLRVLHHYNKVRFRYVLWDSWFSSRENLAFVHHELKKFFVGAIEKSRTVALSWEEKLAGEFKKVGGLDLQKDRAITVWLKGTDFPVQLTKQVFKNKDGSTGELYVVTNDLGLSAKAISTTYDKRWGVEVLHKSLKQNVGLEKSPTKNEVTQSNHIFAAMVAWTKLELLSKLKGTNHFALKKQLYVNALKSAFDELLAMKQVNLKLQQASAQGHPLLG